MGFLDTVFNVNASRNGSQLNDIKYAKELDQEKANLVRQKQNNGRMETLQTLKSDPSVLNNEYFNGDEELLNTFMQDLQQRQTNSTDFKAITVSDIMKVKGTGYASKYINDTGLAGTYFGEGARLDGDSTQFKIVDGEYVMVNPTVRAFDSEKGNFYSADATAGGEKVRDLFRKGGDDAVQEASYKNVPLAFVDELDSEYRGAVQDKTGGNSSFGYFGGGPFGGTDRKAIEQEYIGRQNQNEGRIEESNNQIATADAMDAQEKTQLEVERKATELKANAAKSEREDYALQTYGFLQRPGSGTDGAGNFDRLEVEGRIGTSLYDSIFTDDNGAREDGQLDFGNRKDGQKFALSTILVGGSIDGTKDGADKLAQVSNDDFPVTTEGIAAAGLSSYSSSPGGLPFDMTQEQFGSLGDEQQLDVIRLAKNVSDKNLKDSFGDLAGKETLKWNEGMADIDKADEGNQARRDARPTIEAAKKFYEAQGMTDFFANGEVPSDNKLIKRLTEQPELMEEFKKDPTAFASKYANDDLALYGPPKKASMLKQIYSKLGKEFEDGSIEKALVTRDTDSIRRIAKEQKALSTADQEKIVAEIERTGGDFGRYTNKERIGLYFSVVASLPPGSDAFKSLTEGGNFENMVESGVLNFNKINAETENIKARTAAKKERRIGLTPDSARDVNVDIATLSEQIYGPDADEKTNRVANATLNAQLSKIGSAANSPNGLSGTNIDQIAAITTIREGQMSEWVKANTEPSLLDELFTLGAARTAGKTIFTENIRLKSMVDGVEITSKEQWFMLSKDEQQRVEIIEPNSMNQVSPQGVTRQFGPGAVETLIFRGM